MSAVRCLSIAGSDSGGGAGIAADLRAFAAQGCHGMTAIVAVTAQNSVGVSAVHEIPPEIITAQFDAVFDDIGVDAAKTGMLGSRATIEVVASALQNRAAPLVVDPVILASSGAALLQPDAISALVRLMFPLATVITPNLPEATTLCGREGSRRELAEQLHDMGAAAVVVTGGHGVPPIDHLFDGRTHEDIPVPRHATRTTHGAGCTHSATLGARLAHGDDLVTAATTAARVAAAAVEHGLSGIGAGEGPVNVLPGGFC
ncbi:MAG: bifunctional hydroxymethylpyrimidine kinase/phosphomethylpyrimidine kinase [Candidatus Dormibacteria bacterium]